MRAEVELAKSEVTGEVRKGLTGSVFFAVAAAIGLFSLFFLFFALAELLSAYFLRWVAFAIVFVLMVLGAALIFGLLGYRKVHKIRKPERTIESLRESAQMLQQRARPEPTSRAGRSERRHGALTGRRVLWRAPRARRAEPDASSVRLPGPWQHRDVSANGIRLHVAECGASRVRRWSCCCTASRSSGGPGATSCPRWPTPGSAPSRWTCADTATPTSRPRGYDLWTFAGDVAGWSARSARPRRGSSGTAGAA